MKALKELLSELTFTCERGNLEKEITAVVYDSRKIVEGCLFVCIKGANFDGHQAAAEAAEKKSGCDYRVPRCRASETVGNDPDPGGGYPLCPRVRICGVV